MYSLLMPGAHARSPKPNWLTTILPVFKRPNHTYKKKKYLVVNLKLDLCNSAMPDERAIMTYVSSYYHCFAGKIKVNLAIHSTDHNWCRPYHFFIFTIFFYSRRAKGSSDWTIFPLLYSFFFSRGIVPDDTSIHSMGYIYCLLLRCFTSVPCERLCMTCAVFFDESATPRPFGIRSR